MTNITRQASGAVIFDTAGNRILLVTSSKDKAAWVLPKGGIDEGFTPQENAVKEAAEEAGVMFIFPRNNYITEFSRPKDGGTQREFYFLGRFITYCEWPEAFARKRAWFTPQEAIAILPPQQAEVIEQAVEMWNEYREGREYESAIHIAGQMQEMAVMLDNIRNHLKLLRMSQQFAGKPTPMPAHDRLFANGIEPESGVETVSGTELFDAAERQNSERRRGVEFDSNITLPEDIHEVIDTAQQFFIDGLQDKALHDRLTEAHQQVRSNSFNPALGMPYGNKHQTEPGNERSESDSNVSESLSD